MIKMKTALLVCRVIKKWPIQDAAASWLEWAAHQAEPQALFDVCRVQSHAKTARNLQVRMRRKIKKALRGNVFFYSFVFPYI